jgi:hypothetical protein
MSQYITVFDDEHPVVFIKGQPWANLTQIKQSLPLHEIYDVEMITIDGKQYLRYTVKV